MGDAVLVGHAGSPHAVEWWPLAEGQRIGVEQAALDREHVRSIADVGPAHSQSGGREHARQRDRQRKVTATLAVGVMLAHELPNTPGQAPRRCADVERPRLITPADPRQRRRLLRRALAQCDEAIDARFIIAGVEPRHFGSIRNAMRARPFAGEPSHRSAFHARPSRAAERVATRLALARQPVPV